MALQKNIMFALVLVLGFWVSQSESRSLIEANTTTTIHEKYKDWMARYGRVYKDGIEREMRFKIFKSNVERIESFNKRGDKTYKLSINKFADLTGAEFMASRNRLKRLERKNVKSSSHKFRYENVTAPIAVDWRSKGAVTMVKDQGECGNYGFFTVTVVGLTV